MATADSPNGPQSQPAAANASSSSSSEIDATLNPRSTELVNQQQRHLVYKDDEGEGAESVEQHYHTHNHHHLPHQHQYQHQHQHRTLHGGTTTGSAIHGDTTSMTGIATTATITNNITLSSSAVELLVKDRRHDSTSHSCSTLMKNDNANHNNNHAVFTTSSPASMTPPSNPSLAHGRLAAATATTTGSEESRDDRTQQPSSPRTVKDETLPAAWPDHEYGEYGGGGGARGTVPQRWSGSSLSSSSESGPGSGLGSGLGTGIGTTQQCQQQQYHQENVQMQQGRQQGGEQGHSPTEGERESRTQAIATAIAGGVGATTQPPPTSESGRQGRSLSGGVFAAGERGGGGRAACSPTSSTATTAKHTATATASSTHPSFDGHRPASSAAVTSSKLRSPSSPIATATSSTVAGWSPVGGGGGSQLLPSSPSSSSRKLSSSPSSPCSSPTRTVGGGSGRIRDHKHSQSSTARSSSSATSSRDKGSLSPSTSSSPSSRSHHHQRYGQYLSRDGGGGTPIYAGPMGLADDIPSPTPSPPAPGRLGLYMSIHHHGSSPSGTVGMESIGAMLSSATSGGGSSAHQRRISPIHSPIHSPSGLLSPSHLGLPTFSPLQSSSVPLVFTTGFHVPDNNNISTNSPTSAASPSSPTTSLQQSHLQQEQQQQQQLQQGSSHHPNKSHRDRHGHKSSKRNKDSTEASTFSSSSSSPRPCSPSSSRRKGRKSRSGIASTTNKSDTTSPCTLSQEDVDCSPSSSSSSIVPLQSFSPSSSYHNHGATVTTAGGGGTERGAGMRIATSEVDEDGDIVLDEGKVDGRQSDHRDHDEPSSGKTKIGAQLSPPVVLIQSPPSSSSFPLPASSSSSPSPVGSCLPSSPSFRTNSSSTSATAASSSHHSTPTTASTTSTGEHHPSSRLLYLPGDSSPLLYSSVLASSASTFASAQHHSVSSAISPDRSVSRLPVSASISSSPRPIKGANSSHSGSNSAGAGDSSRSPRISAAAAATPPLSPSSHNKDESRMKLAIFEKNEFEAWTLREQIQERIARATSALSVTSPNLDAKSSSSLSPSLSPSLSSSKHMQLLKPIQEQQQQSAQQGLFGSMQTTQSVQTAKQLQHHNLQQMSPSPAQHKPSMMQYKPSFSAVVQAVPGSSSGNNSSSASSSNFQGDQLHSSSTIRQRSAEARQDSNVFSSFSSVESSSMAVDDMLLKQQKYQQQHLGSSAAERSEHGLIKTPQNSTQANERAGLKEIISVGDEGEKSAATVVGSMSQEHHSTMTSSAFSSLLPASSNNNIGSGSKSATTTPHYSLRKSRSAPNLASSAGNLSYAEILKGSFKTSTSSLSSTNPSQQLQQRSNSGAMPGPSSTHSSTSSTTSPSSLSSTSSPSLTPTRTMKPLRRPSLMASKSEYNLKARAAAQGRPLSSSSSSTIGRIVVSSGLGGSLGNLHHGSTTGGVGSSNVGSDNQGLKFLIQKDSDLSLEGGNGGGGEDKNVGASGTSSSSTQSSILLEGDENGDMALLSKPITMDIEMTDATTRTASEEKVAIVVEPSRPSPLSVDEDANMSLGGDIVMTKQQESQMVVESGPREMFDNGEQHQAHVLLTDASLHAQSIVAAAMMMSFEQDRGVVPPADPVNIASTNTSETATSCELQTVHNEAHATFKEMMAEDRGVTLTCAAYHQTQQHQQYDKAMSERGSSSMDIDSENAGAIDSSTERPEMMVHEEPQQQSALDATTMTHGEHVAEGQSADAVPQQCQEDDMEDEDRGPNSSSSSAANTNTGFNARPKRNSGSGGKRLQLKRSTSSLANAAAKKSSFGARQLGGQVEASQSIDTLHLLGAGGDDDQQQQPQPLCQNATAIAFTASEEVDVSVSSETTTTTTTVTTTIKKTSARRKSKESLCTAAASDSSSPPKTGVMEIPQFYFPMGRPIASSKRLQKVHTALIMAKEIFLASSTQTLAEDGFVDITVQCCELPRYMNRALFRKCEVLLALSSSRTSTPTPAHPSPPSQQQQHQFEGIRYEDFERIWSSLVEVCPDEISLIFQILKQPHNSSFLTPADFEVVLQDLVLFHPGLEFLSGNTVFQERYLETVITRIFYEANRRHGRMTLADLRKAEFDKTLRRLENSDLNQTDDCFSYKHFYVIYCKFWELDQDHDLILDEHDLAGYAGGAISSRIIRRVMQGYGNEMGMFIAPDPTVQQQQQQMMNMMQSGSMGTVNLSGDGQAKSVVQQTKVGGVNIHGMEVEAAVGASQTTIQTDDSGVTQEAALQHSQSQPIQPMSMATMMMQRPMRPGPGIQVRPQQYRMTYKGFIWFLLAETDKQTPTSIEYWFRCMDLDGDGVLSVFELEQLFQEQAQRMAILGMESFVFRDAVCQMQDLVSPKDVGLVRLSDLKHCGQAGPFIDLFCNVVRWRSFEAHQHQIRMRQQQIAMQRAADAAWEEVAAGGGEELFDMDEDDDDDGDDDDDDEGDDDEDMAEGEGAEFSEDDRDEEEEESDDESEDDREATTPTEKRPLILPDPVTEVEQAATQSLDQDGNQPGPLLDLERGRSPSPLNQQPQQRHRRAEIEENEDNISAGCVGLGVEGISKIDLEEYNRQQQICQDKQRSLSGSSLSVLSGMVQSSADDQQGNAEGVPVEEEGADNLDHEKAASCSKEARERRRRRRRRRMSLARRAELEELRKEKALLATIRESPWIVYVEAEYEKLVTIERPQSRSAWEQEAEEDEDEEEEEEEEEGEEVEEEEIEGEEHERVLQQQQLQQQQQQQQQQHIAVLQQQQQQQLQQVRLLQQQQQFVLQQQLQLQQQQQQLQLQQQQQQQQQQHAMQALELQVQMDHEAVIAATGGMMAVSTLETTSLMGSEADDFEQIPMDVD